LHAEQAQVVRGNAICPNCALEEMLKEAPRDDARWRARA
jgi:hypothetical protein